LQIGRGFAAKEQRQRRDPSVGVRATGRRVAGSSCSVEGFGSSKWSSEMAVRRSAFQLTPPVTRTGPRR